MTKKTREILMFAVIFSLIIVTALSLAFDYKQLRTQKAPGLNTVYQANFNNRKCDFCAVQLADFYELSHSRETGRTHTEYLCKECHQFLHYEQFLDTFTKKRVKK